MAGKQSAAIERALKSYMRNPGRVYKIAARHKVSPSALYRAINRMAKEGR